MVPMANKAKKHAKPGNASSAMAITSHQPAGYADGGMVGAFKRLIGVEKDTPERAAYKAQAAAARATPAPVAPAPAQSAITGYTGMSVMQRREKEAGLKDGGMIEGPGTGTSDSIKKTIPEGSFIMPADSTKQIGAGKGVPTRVSNGEFEFTPEKVHSIGAAVLMAMKDATHTPTGGPVAKGGMPARSDGTKKEDLPQVSIPPAETGASTISPSGSQIPMGQGAADRLANQSSMYVLGAQAANPVQPEAAPVIRPQPATQQPASTRPMDAQAVGDRKTAADIMGSIGNASESAGRAIADIGTMPIRGLAGAYDSTVVRGMRAAGLNAGYLSPLLTPNGAAVDSMTPFTDVMRAREQSNQPSAAPTAAAAAPARAALPQASYSNEGRHTVQPTAMPNGTSPTTGRIPAGTDLGNGISRIDEPGKSPLFTNVTNVADNAALMNRAPMTAQNRMAMDGIQGRQDARDAGAAAKMQYDSEVAQANATNEWQRNRQEPIDVNRARSPYMQAKLIELQNQRRNQELQSEKEKRSDATQRYQIDATSNNNQRSNATAQQRLSMDQTSQGFDNRAKAQLEQAQLTLISAKTPQEIESATEKLRALQGKYEKFNPNRYTVVPGGQESDMNGIRTRPSEVIDNQTGQFINRTGSADSKPIPQGLVVGAPYKGADGVYSVGSKSVTIKAGKVTEIK